MGRNVVVMRNIKPIIIRNEYHAKRMFVTKISPYLSSSSNVKRSSFFREMSNRNG
jgi:hypothetical protein